MAKLRSIKNKGFSLLEVIIAVGVLAVAIVIILQSLSYSARIAGLSADFTDAVLLAKDKLQELEFAQERGELTVGGMPSGTKNKFSWSYNLTEIDQDSKLYKLVFKINWSRMNQGQDIHFSSNLKNYEI